MEAKQEDRFGKKPEIIIGLVARMGADLVETVTSLKSELSKYGYAADEIKVTKTLEYIVHNVQLYDAPIEKRYKSYIEGCNWVREHTGRNDIFGLLAASTIDQIRSQVQEGPHRGFAYIVNQLKRPEEVTALRNIYGDAFIAISCHAPLQRRINYLANKITSEHGGTGSEDGWRAEAQELISMDERENSAWGQNVRSAFPLADYILDASSKKKVTEGISRLLRLVFGDPRLSPLFEEYGNNLAAQAALRSVDLSRQVGAAIFDEQKKIIALGCNEVPKSGGGTYWEREETDARDHQVGHDKNTLKKRELVIDVVRNLQNKNILFEEWDGRNEDELTKVLLDDEGAPLKDAKILDILEYGRALHAEMNAITDAARSNSSTQDSTLFVTTFPCHNCAKHIVGAGIVQVYYLEPYAKSEVLSLYPDSINIDPENGDGRVDFKQFCGVTKLRFGLYSKQKLKDSRGVFIPWSERSAKCLLRNNPSDYQIYEELAVQELNKIAEEKDLFKEKE